MHRRGTGAFNGKRYCFSRYGAEPFERPLPRGPCLEVVGCVRHPVGAPDHHNAVASVHGKGRQDAPVDETEHERREPDTHRQRNQDHGARARRLDQHAEAIAHIGDESIHGEERHRNSTGGQPGMSLSRARHRLGPTRGAPEKFLDVWVAQRVVGA